MAMADLCQTVRLTLVELPPDDPLWSSLEFAAQYAHRESCPLCQVLCAAEREADQALRAALHDVSIPTDLTGRLLSRLRQEVSTNTVPAPMTVGLTDSATVPNSLTDAYEQPVASPVSATGSSAGIPRTSRRSQLRRWVSVAAAVLLMIAGVWAIWPRTPRPDISLPHLLATLTREFPNGQPAGQVTPSLFQGAFAPELPLASELRYRPEQLASTVYSLRLSGTEVAAVYSLPLEVSRRPFTATVVLLVADLRRVRIPEADLLPPAFAQSEAHYTGQYVARVWRRGEFVYVCLVPARNAELLEALRPMLHAA